MGLQYNTLNNDEYFNGFCELLYKYQYVQKYTEITAQIIDWLYEHSGGVTSVVVSLIHDAQEIAILTGYETLDITMLNQAYNQRLQLLHDFIRPNVTAKPTRKKKKTVHAENQTDTYTISALVQKSKDENLDIVPLLQEYFTVEEVKL